LYLLLYHSHFLWLMGVNAMWTTESTHIVKLYNNLRSQASHDVETGIFFYLLDEINFPLSTTLRETVPLPSGSSFAEWQTTGTRQRGSLPSARPSTLYRVSGTRQTEALGKEGHSAKGGLDKRHPWPSLLPSALPLGTRQRSHLCRVPSTRQRPATWQD